VDVEIDSGCILIHTGCIDRRAACIDSHKGGSGGKDTIQGACCPVGDADGLRTACRCDLSTGHTKDKQRMSAACTRITARGGRFKVDRLVAGHEGLLDLLGFCRGIRSSARCRAGVDILIDDNAAHPSQIHLARRITVQHDGDIAVTLRDDAIIGKYRTVRHEEADGTVRRYGLYRPIEDDDLADDLIS